MLVEVKFANDPEAKYFLRYYRPQNESWLPKSKYIIYSIEMLIINTSYIWGNMEKNQMNILLCGTWRDWLQQVVIKTWNHKTYYFLKLREGNWCTVLNAQGRGKQLPNRVSTNKRDIPWGLLHKNWFQLGPYVSGFINNVRLKLFPVLGFIYPIIFSFKWGCSDKYIWITPLAWHNTNIADGLCCSSEIFSHSVKILHTFCTL